jgi:hypothetical protein
LVESKLTIELIDAITFGGRCQRLIQVAVEPQLRSRLSKHPAIELILFKLDRAWVRSSQIRSGKSGLSKGLLRIYLSGERCPPYERISTTVCLEIF